MQHFIKYLILTFCSIIFSITGIAQFSLSWSKTDNGDGTQTVTLTAVEGATVLNNAWGSGNLVIRIPLTASGGTGVGADITTFTNPSAAGINWVDPTTGAVALRGYQKEDAPYSLLGLTNDAYIYIILINNQTGALPSFSAGESRDILTFRVPISWNCIQCVEILFADDNSLNGWNTVGITTASDLYHSSYFAGGVSLFTPTVNGDLGFGILPIVLKNFTATKNIDEKAVNLNWEVATETNTKSYEIQHSTDGINFTLLTTVNATNSQNYRAQHNTPSYGINYYRLYSVDIDRNKRAEGPIRTVKFDNATSLFAISPNPLGAGEQLSLTIQQNSYSGGAQVVVTDLAGRRVHVSTINVAKGFTIAKVSTNGLNAGTYLVSIVDNNGKKLVETKKLIKYSK